VADRASLSKSLFSFLKDLCIISVSFKFHKFQSGNSKLIAKDKKVNITVSFYKDHVQESFVNTHPGVRGVPLDLKIIFSPFMIGLSCKTFLPSFLCCFLDKIFELILPKCW
jgi:hypothetical protein